MAIERRIDVGKKQTRYKFAMYQRGRQKRGRSNDLESEIALKIMVKITMRTFS